VLNVSWQIRERDVLLLRGARVLCAHGEQPFRGYRLAGVRDPFCDGVLLLCGVRV